MKLSQFKKFAYQAVVLELLTLVLASIPAVAATGVTTFAVTAMVQATCLVSATSLTFGTYTGVTVSNTATVSVICSNRTPYDVSLDNGEWGGRRMDGPAASRLAYGLYSDVNRTVSWGNTVGRDSATGTGTGALQALTVYGQIPPGQWKNPGAYADMVTVTIYY